MPTSNRPGPSAGHAVHAFNNFHGTTREGLTLVDRRGMLKAGVAGVAGLSLPALEGRQGDRRRPVDLVLHPRGRKRPRHRPEDQVPASRRRRFLVDTRF